MQFVSVHEYLIDHSDIDWATVLRPWHSLLPRELIIWLMNCFGDLVLVANDGTVHVFEVGAGTVLHVIERTFATGSTIVTTRING